MKTLYKILFILSLIIYQAGYSQCWFSELIKDFDKNPAEFKEFMKTEPDAMYAYEQLYKAGRKGLKQNTIALKSYGKVIKNEKLKTFGFTDEILAKVKASRLDDGDFASILDDLDNFGKVMASKPSIEFDNFKNIISKLTDNNPQNSQAAHWIIQDVTQNADEFVGKKWSIEFLVKNSDGNNAFVDVAAVNKSKFIEYKWLTSNTIGKEDFIREFIKRDLSNPDIVNFSQLEWRIKGMKLSKEKMLEYLSSTEGKEALKKISAEKANKMLGRSDLKDITELQKNKIADAIIEHFSDQSNFNNIFK